MLSSDEDSQSILDRPGLVFQVFSGANELLPGKHVGKYVLRELIGEGATSLVFRAQQFSPVERDVALKILKPGMDSQRILARFGLEHQVIERLEHPGITPVFDVAVLDNGRPYFAMELVPNPLPITRYAEQFCPDLRSRVQLMIATCEIVQHAHQRGVIHRDLKPTNILIEGVPQERPKPRIIDFGIAKIMEPGTDTSNFTTLGDRFGTPAYMSPEQALMSPSSLDIRTDVYSLGAVFFEMVTGSTPRNASGSAASGLPWTSEAYWKYEIPLPSRWRRMQTKPARRRHPFQRWLAIHHEGLSEKAPGGSEQELDLIVLKAIANDREERYQTVSDLQRDLERFLNGEPIEAAGPGMLYRLKKWVSRNRAISAAAVVALMTIITTSILTTSYALRANEAEHQVRLQLKETLNSQKELLVQRDRAEEAMRQSQSLLRVFQVQTVTDRSLGRFLKNILEEAQRGQVAGQPIDQPTLAVEVNVLMKPHDRLIVRGDWQWASSRFPAEIVNTSFQLTSGEAARALPQSLAKNKSDDPSATAKDTSGATSPRAIKDRESLQSILLEELRLVLPSDDPFIAGVLDNCGLLALDRHQPTDAIRHLSESVRIWGKSPRYLSNLAQSQLFLAEALLREGEINPSDAMLREATQSIARIPKDTPYVAPLQEFLGQLQAERDAAR